MAATWNDVVYLVGITEGTDEDGFPAIVPGEPRKVFVNKKSIHSQEYYAAKQSGIKLSYMFEIRTEDYQGEEVLRYNDKDHNIERMYEKGDFVELICTKKSDDHEI